MCGDCVATVVDFGACINAIWSYKKWICVVAIIFFLVSKAINAMYTIIDLRVSLELIKSSVKGWMDPKTVFAVSFVQKQYEEGGSPSSFRFWSNYLKSISRLQVNNCIVFVVFMLLFVCKKPLIFGFFICNKKQ